MSVAVSKRLSLVIPIEVDEKTTFHVHSQPILSETFKHYHSVLAKAFNQIHSGGYGIAGGSRIAEEKFMHHMTTGAGNDIERASDLVRKMVCEWGMSDLGPMSYGKKEEQIFLGREIAQHRDYSEATAIRIDEQVRRMVQQGYDTAEKIITEHSDALVQIAETLLIREILDGAEVMKIVRGQPLDPMPTPDTKDSGGDTQQVLRPEGQRRLPGLTEGERPQPA